MANHPDFEELLALFNAKRVDYVIVGAFAPAHHGVPRYTGDLDILIMPTGKNVEQLLDALNAFISKHSESEKIDGRTSIVRPR